MNLEPFRERVLFEEKKGKILCRIFGHDWSFGRGNAYNSFCIRCGMRQTESVMWKRWEKWHEKFIEELK